MEYFRKEVSIMKLNSRRQKAKAAFFEKVSNYETQIDRKEDRRSFQIWFMLQAQYKN